jgi:signal transduction histidine kinase
MNPFPMRTLRPLPLALPLAVLLRRSNALQRRQRALQARMEADNAELVRQAAQRTAQWTERAQHLQTAREDERGRLARDLHDELGALLTSAKLDIARLRSRLAGSTPEAMERLSHLNETLDGIVTLKRRVIEDLRPSSLDHLGLLATIEILAREFGARSGVRMTLMLKPVPLAADAEIVVYRVVQEALTNIAKYARATQVWITLGPQAGAVELEVRDDGIGFDPGGASRAAHGLEGMRFRAEAAQGSLSVHAAPGAGTRIVLLLPVAPAS